MRYFKSLIPTFGPLQYVNMIKKYLPKVGIKFLKISHIRILFLVSLLFVVVINPYSVFKFLIFRYSSTYIHCKKLICYYFSLDINRILNAEEESLNKLISIFTSFGSLPHILHDNLLQQKMTVDDRLKRLQNQKLLFQVLNFPNKLYSIYT